MKYIIAEMLLRGNPVLVLDGTFHFHAIVFCIKLMHNKPLEDLFLKFNDPSLLQRVSKADLGEVVILNADNNTVETPFDDLETLPTDVVMNILLIGLIFF